MLRRIKPRELHAMLVMKGWRFALLVFVLFLFGLILVLPQVDLPDFTFHRGSAPLAAKAQVSSPPVLSAVAAPRRFPSPQAIAEVPERYINAVVHSAPRALLYLLCSLLC
jgi:hypothetical protein